MSYPERRPRGLTLEQSFRWFEPIPIDGCLLWPASTTAAGYGQFVHEYRHHYAHVVSYELTYGPVPPGMIVDHIECVAPSCIEPAHLRAVTHKQNMENRHGARADSKSGIRGVWLVQTPSGPRWHGCVVHNRHRYALNFHTAADAEAWVVAKRQELFTHSEMDRLAQARA